MAGARPALGAGAAGALERASEAVLARAARDGDARAFGELYERYVGPVYRFCLARLRRVEDAEDVTSAVFIKLVQAMPRYDERGVPFSAFVFRVARNAVVDHVRRRRTTVPLDALEAEPEHAGVEGPDAAAISERQDLVRALASLPDLHREVVVLRFVEGYEAAEVARIVGKSQAAVRSIQHRAMRQLRTALGGPPARDQGER